MAEHSLSAQDEVLTDVDLLRKAASEAAEYLEAVASKTSRNAVWERCDSIANDLRHALTAAAPSPAVAGHLPSTPDEVIAFLGTNFDTSWTQGEKEGWRYKVSVHDLLSAFGDWEDQPSPSLAVRDIPREPTSEMMEAANRQREVGGDTKDCWRAMWDAAMREQP